MKFSKIVIQTSPFVRTLMTANGIALGLFGDDVDVEIQVDSHLAEYFGNFKTNPMLNLEIYKPQNDQERQAFYDKYQISKSVQINTKDDSYADKISTHFPESNPNGIYRQTLTHNFMLNKL